MLTRAAIIAAVICATSPTLAQSFDYARGHWICRAGTFEIGTLDVADETYSFVDAKGVGGRGELSYSGEGSFEVVSGPLRDSGKIASIDVVDDEEGGGARFEFWVDYSEAPAATCTPA